MGNAWMGAMTDIMHNVWMGCMEDAQTGAMTDITHNVWTDCTDNAWTGALKGVMYNVLMDGDFAMFSCRYFTTFFSHNYRGISMGLQQTVMS